MRGLFQYSLPDQDNLGDQLFRAFLRNLLHSVFGDEALPTGVEDGGQDREQ